MCELIWEKAGCVGEVGDLKLLQWCCWSCKCFVVWHVRCV